MTRFRQIFRPMVVAAMAVLCAGLASGSALADTARSWTLQNQSGQVHVIKSGIAPIALTVGDLFAAGDWIETGPDGRAVLRRGEETIVVAPNSRIGLPRESTGPFATQILQTLGTVLLTVEKKANRHFEVQTPYLTAVVKGTTFTVGIVGGRATVHVVEGLVEVKNLASGRTIMVRPGQTGSVLRDGPADVNVEGGSANKAAQVKSKAPAGEARGNTGQVSITKALGPDSLNLTDSTKGLVRAASETPAQTGVAGARAAGGRALALGQGATANPDLANSNGLKVGRGLTANPGLANGNGLAVGQGLAANPGLGNGNGLAVGQGLTANPGLGNAVAAVAALAANGNGRAVGQGQTSNPRLAKGHAKGTANGNGGNDK